MPVQTHIENPTKTRKYVRNWLKGRRAYIQAYLCTYIHIRIHTNILIPMHTHTHTHKHSYAHTYTHRLHVGAVYLATDDESEDDDITQPHLCIYTHRQGACGCSVSSNR